MVVDFGRVGYVGSAMLGTFIRLSKRIHETGGSLKLCTIPPLLLEMFVIIMLNRVFETHPERQAAITSFAAPLTVLGNCNTLVTIGLFGANLADCGGHNQKQRIL